MLFLYLLTVLVLMIMASLYLREKYDIVFDFFSIYRPVNEKHKWIERILLIVDIILIIIFGIILTSIQIFAILFASIAILEGLRTYMEYKYFKEAKAYYLHMVGAVGNFFLFIGVLVGILI